MSHVPHELGEEFPEHKSKIQSLNQSDAHFARLADDYHNINRQVHRIETNITPADEAYEKQLRRQRMALKDEIAAYLK